MVFSLFQQLVRQDPAYYLAQVHARNDKETRLISYPTPALVYPSGCDEGDVFTEIDSEDYKKDRKSVESRLRDFICVGGRNSVVEYIPKIQSVCRRWVPGFNKRSGNYFDLSKTVSGKNMKSLLETFKVEWVTKDLPPGQVFVAKPGVPMRLMGDEKAGDGSDDFVIFSASYTAIEEGGKLEGGGDLEDVVRSHRRMIPPSFGRYVDPDGLDCVPYKSPFAVELCNLGVISDALVGRRDWDSPVVQEELSRLISLSTEEREAYFHKWRKTATVEMKKMMLLVEKLDRQCYGDKSYYKLRDETPSGERIDVESDDERLRSRELKRGSPQILKDTDAPAKRRAKKGMGKMVGPETTITVEENEGAQEDSQEDLLLAGHSRLVETVLESCEGAEKSGEANENSPEKTSEGALEKNSEEIMEAELVKEIERQLIGGIDVTPATEQNAEDEDMQDDGEGSESEEEREPQLGEDEDFDPGEDEKAAAEDGLEEGELDGPDELRSSGSEYDSDELEPPRKKVKLILRSSSQRSLRPRRH